MIKKTYYIMGLVAVVLSLAACNTIALAPLDDAYYWPEKEIAKEMSKQAAQPASQPAKTTTQQSVQQSSQPEQLPLSEVKSSEQPIQYINVQDTTVTVKIKR